MIILSSNILLVRIKPQNCIKHQWLVNLLKLKKIIINILPGSKYIVKEILDEVGTFQIIFPNQMVDEIIHYTNMYILYFNNSKKLKWDEDAKCVKKK